MVSQSINIPRPASNLVATLNRAHAAGALVTEFLMTYPDMNLATVRLSEQDGRLTVDGEVKPPPEALGPPLSAWSPEPWELR